MQIKLSPVRRDMTLVVTKQGDVLTVNGQDFDFTSIPEGATLPAEAIDLDLFCGPVERVNGELILTLMLPHGPNPSQAVAFPQTLSAVADGPVELPQ